MMPLEKTKTVRTISLTPQIVPERVKSFRGGNKPKVTIQKKVLIPLYAQIRLDDVSENVKTYLRNKNPKDS